MSAPPINESALPAGLSPQLLREFTFEAGASGPLRVVKKGRARRRNLALIATMAAFWLGLIALGVASFLGWKPVPGWGVHFDPVGLILALPFIMLLGLVLIWVVLWRVLGREEWLISRNCLEWHGRLLGIRWRRRYHDAEPVIWAAKDPGVSHLVIPLGRSKWRVTRVLYESYKLDDVVAIGRVLTACTGWPVSVVQRADD